jgi:hypothetical protein
MCKRMVSSPIYELQKLLDHQHFKFFNTMHEVCHFFSLFFKTKSLRITLLQCSPFFYPEQYPLHFSYSLYIKIYNTPRSPTSKFIVHNVLNCAPQLHSFEIMEECTTTESNLCMNVSNLLKFTLLAPSSSCTFELWCFSKWQKFRSFI